MSHKKTAINAVFSSRHLMSIVVIVGAYEVISTIVDFQFTAEAAAAYDTRDGMAGFQGKVFFVGQIVSVGVQLLLTSFIHRRFGVTAGQFITAPLRLPQRLLQIVVYPTRPLFTWFFLNRIPERTVDLLSDDTRRIWVLPSAGYSSTDGFHLGGTFKYNNLFYQKKDLQLSGILHANLDRSVSGSFSKRPTPSSPVLFRVRAGYSLDTDSDYYGMGITSHRGDKSIFALEQASYTISTGFRFVSIRGLTLVGRFGLDWAESGRGADHAAQSRLQDTFENTAIQGFEESVLWLRFGGAITHDTRGPGGHPYQGHVLSAEADRYEDPRGKHSYWLFTARAKKLFDLHRKMNVLVLGLRFQSIANNNRPLPFYRLPTLDLNSGLRGFPGGRFRARRTLAGNIEYRFPIWRAIEKDPFFGLGVLFFDLGKPFDDLDSLAQNGVRYSVGAAFVLTTRSKFMARFQLGYGGEGIETQTTMGFAF